MPAPKGGAQPPATSTASAVDGSLWLCLLAPDAVLKAVKAGTPAATLQLVRDKIAGHVINLGVRTDDALCGATDAQRCPDPGSAPARWPVRYDISTGAFSGAARHVDKIVYQRLTVAADTTNSMGQSGTVRLRLPDRRGDGSTPFGDWTADSFETPDDDLLGVGGLPPRLDDPKLAARVLAWIRVRRIDLDDPPIRVRLIDANMVMAEQAVSAAPELLGNGTGLAGQTLRLSKTPVIAGSETVQVRAEAGWQPGRGGGPWRWPGPDDPFYALDPIDGTITFGDGVHGRMPLPGRRSGCSVTATAAAWPATSAPAGISRVRGAALKAINPLPAEGGQDAETTAQAQARIPQVLRARDRAVCTTTSSRSRWRRPACTWAAPRCCRGTSRSSVPTAFPGVVTVIVLPAADPVTPDTPTPDREMLRRVCAWLEPRRLVTTELYVTPPEYVPVDIAIAVDAEPDTGEETLRRWVELALRQYFAPLPPYGPAAPAGRSAAPCATATPRPPPCTCRACSWSTKSSCRAKRSMRPARRPTSPARCRCASGSCPCCAPWPSAIGPTAPPLDSRARRRPPMASPRRCCRRPAEPCANPPSRI